MSIALSPVIGTIRIEPRACDRPGWAGDDSTLDHVLASYANSGLLDSEPELRIVACTRLSRLGSLGEPVPGMRANLAQLLDDLQAEYDQLADRLAG